MLTVLGSIKGSAGVTTLAVALAVVWPGDAPVVVEADCGGGDLGSWHWLPDYPGLGSLATQSRTGEVALARHVTTLPCGVDVVLAPAGRQPATVAVGLLAEANMAVWAKKRPIIVDVGRLEPGAPSNALVNQADAVLIVSRGDAGSLMRVAGAAPSHPAVRLVLVGGSVYPHAEVVYRIGTQVGAEVPWDPHAAAVLSGRRPPRGGWTRRGLPSAARALAMSLVESRRPRPGW